MKTKIWGGVLIALILVSAVAFFWSGSQGSIEAAMRASLPNDAVCQRAGRMLSCSYAAKSKPGTLIVMFSAEMDNATHAVVNVDLLQGLAEAEASLGKSAHTKFLKAIGVDQQDAETCFDAFNGAREFVTRSWVIRCRAIKSNGILFRTSVDQK